MKPKDYVELVAMMRTAQRNYFTADDAPQPEDTMSREEIMRILGLAQSISVDPFVRLLND